MLAGVWWEEPQVDKNDPSTCISAWSIPVIMQLSLQFWTQNFYSLKGVRDSLLTLFLFPWYFAWLVSFWFIEQLIKFRCRSPFVGQIWIRQVDLHSDLNLRNAGLIPFWALLLNGILLGYFGCFVLKCSIIDLYFFFSFLERENGNFPNKTRGNIHMMIFNSFE